MSDAEVKGAIISALKDMSYEGWASRAIITTGVGKLNNETNNNKGEGKE